MMKSLFGEGNNNIELTTIPGPSYQPINHDEGDELSDDCNNDKDRDGLGLSSPSPRSKANHLIDLVDQRQQIYQNRQQAGIFPKRNLITLAQRTKLELSWSYPHFSLRDDDFDDDNNKEGDHHTDDDLEEHQPPQRRRRPRYVIVDAQRSFGPASLTAILFRCTWLAGSLLTLYLDISVYDTVLEYLSYLTHLSHLTTTIYQITTCCLSLFATDFVTGRFGEEAAEMSTRFSGNQQQPGCIVCFVWVVYGVALVSELVVALVYWAFLYNGNMSLQNLYVHLFIGFILLFDGNVVGRIPLRLKHMLWFYTYGVLYILWTIIYAHWNMGRSHDGIIYSILDWNNKPKQAAVLVGVLAIVVGPMIFLFCWLCSLWSKGWVFDGGRRIYKEVYVLGGAVKIYEEVVFDETK